MCTKLKAVAALSLQSIFVLVHAFHRQTEIDRKNVLVIAAASTASLRQHSDVREK